MSDEKKIQIYQGVISLIKQGNNFRDLKVSEIAIASNIGKGTCYEYFSSKEEIIQETLIYCFRQEVSEFLVILDQKNNFKETLHQILCQLAVSLTTCSPFQFALSAIGQDDLKLFFPDGHCVETVFQEMTTILTRLLDQGESEKLFLSTDRDYQTFMLLGVLKSFCFSIVNSQWIHQQDQETLIEYAIKGLVKSLQ